jgi:protein TonB
MTTPFNSEENFNELVFENRNKEYGAYALRRAYGNTVTRSMIISFTGVTLFVFLIFWFGKGNEKLPSLGPNIPVIVPLITTVVITPPDKPVEKAHSEKPLPVKSDNGNLVASNDLDKTLNKINEEQNISKDPSDKGIDSAGTDPVELKKADSPVEKKDPEVRVDHMPEFDGNVYQFIKDNLKYPQTAVENGTQGIVGLSFIIEKDGAIGDIKVLRDVGDGCTAEAIRVVKMMPNWKPGMNHGVPVRVVFNLPIKFRLK